MELSDEFILELTQVQQRLLSYIYRRVANREQAQEVLQQTNLVLCRKADDFELGTNFNAWAFAVAHYQILSHRKNVARVHPLVNLRVYPCHQRVGGHGDLHLLPLLLSKQHPCAQDQRQHEQPCSEWPSVKWIGCVHQESKR